VVKVGTYLGNHWGRVTAIGETGLVVTTESYGGDGDLRSVTESLAMPKPPEPEPLEG
jgi:hypothetical protein